MPNRRIKQPSLLEQQHAPIYEKLNLILGFARYRIKQNVEYNWRFELTYLGDYMTPNQIADLNNLIAIRFIESRNKKFIINFMFYSDDEYD